MNDEVTQEVVDPAPAIRILSDGPVEEVKEAAPEAAPAPEGQPA